MYIQHLQQMDEKIHHSKFNCELCDFKCNKKSDFERHLLTRKHKIQQKNAKNLIYPFQFLGKSRD